MTPEFHILYSREEIGSQTIGVWKKTIVEAFRTKGKAFIALSGGSTPGPVYEALAIEGQEFLWDKTHLFLVDERLVPHDHPDSNFGMIKRTLLDKVPIPEENVHPVPILSTARDSAAAYEGEIREAFGIDKSDWPVFDLMIMGIGTDGHTASLFPGDPALAVSDRWVIESAPSDVNHERISLTMPVLQKTKRKVFLAIGENKADRLREVLIEKKEDLPATRSIQGVGENIFYLDLEAASGLI